MDRALWQGLLFCARELRSCDSIEGNPQEGGPSCRTEQILGCANWGKFRNGSRSPVNPERANPDYAPPTFDCKLLASCWLLPVFFFGFFFLFLFL